MLRKKFYFLLLAMLMIMFFGIAHAGIKKVILIANGPFDKDVIEKYKTNATLIALDGAANTLKKHNIFPNIILGDMDSIDQDALSLKDEGGTVVRAPDQDETDLSKGIKYASKTLGAENIYIACAFGGGRTDHTFENLSLLKKHHGNQSKIYIITPTEIIQYIKDDTITFNAPIGGKLGIFGFPKARVISSEGSLKWPLTKEYDLELGVSSSACNIVTASAITLTVTGEILLIRPHDKHG